MADEATEAKDSEERKEPENVTDSGGGLRDGLREGAGELREDISRERIEERLDDAVSDRPLMRYLLDLRTVVKALVIAAVVCLVVSLLLSPKIGAALLVLTFLGAWVGLAARDYNRRRPTKPANDDGDSDDE